MTGPFHKGVMAAFQLSPQIANIFKLDGFFLPGYRSWFVNFGTLSGYIAYLYVHWLLEHTRIFISEFTALFTAIGVIAVYIIFNEVLKDRVASYEAHKRGVVIVFQMMLFCCFVFCISYFINVVEVQILSDVYIVSGTVFLGDTGETASETTMQVFFKQDLQSVEIKTDGNGRYFKIFRKDVLNQIHSLVIRKNTATAVWSKTISNAFPDDGVIKLNEFTF